MDYVTNAYDVLHDRIANLYTMRQEVGGLDKRFLSDSTRQLVIEYMVEEMMERHNPALPSFEHVLTTGHRGFGNYTDMELAIECQQTIAGWCGIDQDNSDEAIFPFATVSTEVRQEITVMLDDVSSKFLR